MAMKNIFCPSCGHETQVNTEKKFSFCTECGNKIVLSQKENLSVNENPPESTELNNDAEITAKLEEIAFYYGLSFEKKEYESIDNDPIYYLKAQDMLVDLSEQYPNDYRIWWELCKPVDYMASDTGSDIKGQYKINEDYFGKALDKADLSRKRWLIEEHDKYIKNKENAKQIAQEKLEAVEKARIEKELADKKAYEEKCEKERLEREQAEENARLQAEAERKRIEEEKFNKEQQRIENEKVLALERENQLAISLPLWQALSGKDYSKIINSYFEMSVENNQTLVGIFKPVSNMLYLNVLRIDGNKGNTIFQEQAFALQFNESGFGIKFNNTPVVIKGYLPPNNVLRITESSNGELYVNNNLLKSNQEFINNITKTAKKPIISFTKYFS